MTRELFFVAGINGLCVLLWWGILHRRSPLEVARDVDRAMQLKGALFTAWEVEGAAFPSSIARRLGQTVASSTTPRQMLRSVLPASLPLLAAPFAACALLLFVLEDSRRDPIQADLKGLVAEMRAGIGAVAADGEAAASDSEHDLSARERQELQQVMRAARELGEELKEGNATEDGLREMAARLAAIEDSLAQSASEQLREGLNRTQAALDAARMSLSGELPGNSETTDSGESGRAGPSSPGSGLASNGADGRMGAPKSHPPRATSPGQPGVLGSPSWPRAYDGIVQRWIETKR